MKIVLAAATAVSLLALSSPAFAGPREKVHLAISSDGYDLTDPSQVDKLRKHIDLVVIEACNPTDMLTNGPSPDLQCRRELRRDAAVKIAALADSAKRERMAGL